MKWQQMISDSPGSEEGFMLLLVGAVDSDHCGPAIFEQIPLPIRRACGVHEALHLISQGLFSVVISERDLPDGNWRDVLEVTAMRPRPPVLIVTDRLADDYLWAEVLNLGGYDVLAKPFDRSEVHRTISLAWQHWQNNSQVLCNKAGK